MTPTSDTSFAGTARTAHSGTLPQQSGSDIDENENAGSSPSGLEERRRRSDETSEVNVQVRIEQSVHIDYDEAFIGREDYTIPRRMGWAARPN